MRRVAQQQVALHRGFANEPEFARFQILDAAMDQARRRGAGAFADVAAINQQAINALQAEITKETAAIDPRADDQDGVVRREPLAE